MTMSSYLRFLQPDEDHYFLFLYADHCSLPPPRAIRLASYTYTRVAKLTQKQRAYVEEFLQRAQAGSLVGDKGGGIVATDTKRNKVDFRPPKIHPPLGHLSTPLGLQIRPRETIARPAGPQYGRKAARGCVLPYAHCAVFLFPLSLGFICKWSFLKLEQRRRLHESLASTRDEVTADTIAAVVKPAKISPLWRTRGRMVFSLCSAKSAVFSPHKARAPRARCARLCWRLYGLTIGGGT